MILNLYDLPNFWLAKVPVTQPITPPATTADVFSGTQFFVALIAGILMAFAFQFLLTNFSFAAGIASGENVLEPEVADSWSGKIQEIESKVGIWALITVNIALFGACFLAVKLTLINSVTLGAITGIVIWSAFFLVILWLSSRTINSLVGSVVDTASSGIQGIMGIATTALGGRAVNARVVNTVEESVASVRRELSSLIEPTAIGEQLQDYLKQLEIPQLNLQEIGKDFENLLKSSDLKTIANSDVLKNLDRQSFIDLVSTRTDLSEQEIEGIADSLENAWQKVVSQQQSTPLALEGLQKVLSTLPAGGGSQPGSALGQQAIGFGMNALLSTVLNRIDFSEISGNGNGDGDGEGIGDRLKQLTQQVTDRAKQLAQQTSQNTIKADVQEYLLSSKSWHLNRETIKQEFREVIYDPEANPGLVRRQLEQLNSDFVVEILNQRDEFSSDKINEIAEQLEGIRQEVLEQVRSAESEQKSNNLRSQIENYLRSTGKEELNPEGIEKDFKEVLEDPQTGLEQLQDRLSQFDRDTLTQMLTQARQDLSEEEANNIVAQLESVRDRVIGEARDVQERAKSKAEEFGNKVESYLRDTNKEELNPEGIKEDLQQLLDEPQQGIKAIAQRLSHFDRDTLVKLLSERGDLSEEEVNRFVDRFLQVRDNILKTPQKLAGKAKDEYEQVTNKIGDYLRNTNLEELNPEGIKQDLNQLFDDPEQGLKNLRDRLSHVDRETLVKLLSQREDLSEERVNEIVDDIQDAIASVGKAPRRLASRTTKQVQSWENQLEDYLRNTDKEELNPEGIKRDLQMLVREPGYGWKQIRDRLSQFDRDTIVSLLSQREDISEEEAEQIFNRIESTRNNLLQQAQKVQDKAQSVVDGTFDQIRNYLNSMERPELNYESIKRDLQKLFEDPEAGVDALRDRLSQFDRDTLVALISSNPAVSEADANRLIDNIEQTRDSVLNRAERLQQEAQKRVDQIKQNAKEQIKQTRKAAATAAWWLFSTALTSAGMAALAGIIAVRGLTIFS